MYEPIKTLLSEPNDCSSWIARFLTASRGDPPSPTSAKPQVLHPHRLIPTDFFGWHVTLNRSISSIGFEIPAWAYTSMPHNHAIGLRVHLITPRSHRRLRTQRHPLNPRRLTPLSSRNISGGRGLATTSQDRISVPCLPKGRLIPGRVNDSDRHKAEWRSVRTGVHSPLWFGSSSPGSTSRSPAWPSHVRWASPSLESHRYWPSYAKRLCRSFPSGLYRRRRSATRSLPGQHQTTPRRATVLLVQHSAAHGSGTPDPRRQNHRRCRSPSPPTSVPTCWPRGATQRWPSSTPTARFLWRSPAWSPPSKGEPTPALFCGSPKSRRTFL